MVEHAMEKTKPSDFLLFYFVFFYFDKYRIQANKISKLFKIQEKDYAQWWDAYTHEFFDDDAKMNFLIFDDQNPSHHRFCLFLFFIFIFLAVIFLDVTCAFHFYDIITLQVKNIYNICLLAIIGFSCIFKSKFKSFLFFP